LLYILVPLIVYIDIVHPEFMAMKKFILLVGLVLASIASKAQLTAVTETGNLVILYDNGTWTYMHKDSINSNEVPVNSASISINPNSLFLLKSTRINMGSYVDTTKWTIKRLDDGEAAEFEINNMESGLYGMLITEKLNLPLESLANIAMDNAKTAAPDVQVIDKQYRTVNGLKVLMMHMTGTIQGIKFSYYGYYYASPAGATQFLVYSSEEIVKQHIPDIEELLNGLVELNN
jgi:hypothetical protein